jgi:hypothetical protein
MKNNEINVTKVLTAGIMTASLIPFITYFQSSENSPQANSEKNDEVNSADSPVSFYAGFQSQNPVFQGGKFLNSDNSHYLTTSAFADLNLGLRIIDATTFSTAFDGTHPDDPYIDVPLDTLINTLNCIDNDIDLGFVPRANNDIMLNYVYSD